MSFEKPPGSTQEIIKRDQICQWVQQLGDPFTRGKALAELNKRREVIPDLGVILWHSFGTVAALLQEIVSVYPSLNPLSLTVPQSSQVCNVLNLLKSAASHPETKSKFVQAQIPVYIFPFLRLYRGRSYESVRIAGLKVIDALVKNNNEEVSRYLISADLLMYILEILENDSKSLKHIAFSILQNIMSHEDGLMRVCETYERFSRVMAALVNVGNELAREATEGSEVPDQVRVLLNHLLQCYLRLSQNVRAREVLSRCLPLHLQDGTFSKFIYEDISLKSVLAQLLNNLGLCPFVFEIKSVA